MHVSALLFLDDFRPWNFKRIAQWVGLPIPKHPRIKKVDITRVETRRVDDIFIKEEVRD